MLQSLTAISDCTLPRRAARHQELLYGDRRVCEVESEREGSGPRALEAHETSRPTGLWALGALGRRPLTGSGGLSKQARAPLSLEPALGTLIAPLLRGLEPQLIQARPHTECGHTQYCAGLWLDSEVEWWLQGAESFEIG